MIVVWGMKMDERVKGRTNNQAILSSFVTTIMKGCWKMDQAGGRAKLRVLLKAVRAYIMQYQNIVVEIEKNKSEHVPNMYWLDHKPVYVSLIKFYSTCSWVFLPVDG